MNNSKVDRVENIDEIHSTDLIKNLLEKNKITLPFTSPKLKLWLVNKLFINILYEQWKIFYLSVVKKTEM